MALLKAAGAKLLTRPPAQLQELESSTPVAKQVVVWDTDAAQPRRAVLHAPNVSLHWVLDTVSRFVVQDCGNYAVQLPT